jgi:hypothetical protein
MFAVNQRIHIPDSKPAEVPAFPRFRIKNHSRASVPMWLEGGDSWREEGSRRDASRGVLFAGEDSTPIPEL